MRKIFTVKTDKLNISIASFNITLKVHEIPKYICAIIVSLVMLFFLVSFLISSQDTNDNGISLSVKATFLPSHTNTPTPDIGVIDISIYITGEVINPGIYKLKSGDLVYDAIKLAGGLTANASEKNINMVYPLKANAMIIIKSIEETAQDSGDNPKDDEQTYGSGLNVAYDSDIVAHEGPVTDSNILSGNNNADTISGKININKASAKDLQQLTGIGEKKSTDIIAYREQNNGFKTIDEITKVNGIGPGTFEKIKDKIII